MSVVEKHNSNRVIRRHLCLVVMGFVTLALLGLIGIVLSQIPVTADKESPLLHPMATLVCRMCLYVGVIWGWPSLVRLRFKINSDIDDWQRLEHHAKNSRKILLVAIVVFELLIVQNVFGWLVGNLWRGNYGG